MNPARTLLALGLVAVVLANASVALAREKTDLVFLKNGDRMTGEITRLDRGILSLKTDNIGTLAIEWEDVDSLNSVYQFRVEDRFGEKYFGAIFLTRSATMQIIQGGVTRTTPAAGVVTITPLEGSFWQRLDGAISLGFSYTKSNSLAQLTTDANVLFRTPLRTLELDLSSITTLQEDEDTQRREDFSLTYNRLFEGPLFVTVSGGVQSNDELGLDLRVSLAPGLGADLVQTNHNSLVSTAGLSVNREWSADNSGGYNLEAFLSVEHSVFRYDYPKTDVTAELTVYPGLTNWGRVRSELDISASREIVKDLTFVLSFYASYDSEPLDVDAAKNDYGLVTSIGWTF
jgi:hypothetical protein